MISRPPLAALILSFAAIIVLVLLALTPSPEGMWAGIAPVSHARWKLRTTMHFMGPNASDEIGVMESPVREWRTLMASPGAIDVLRDLASSGTAAGRVWALSGLLLVDAASARALHAQLSQDSTTVRFIDACEGAEMRSVASLADLVSGPGWAVALRDSVSKCERTSRPIVGALGPCTSHLSDPHSSSVRFATVMDAGLRARDLGAFSVQVTSVRPDVVHRLVGTRVALIPVRAREPAMDMIEGVVDSTGWWHTGELASGEYSMNSRLIGYRSLTTRVNTRVGYRDTIDVRLRQDIVC